MNKLIAMAVFLGGVVPAEAIPPLPATLPVAITHLPYTVPGPGVYYLTANLTLSDDSVNGGYSVYGLFPAIFVDLGVNNVVIDLRGHSITGTPFVFHPLPTPVAAYTGGIVILGNNVTVQNGSITGFSRGLITLNRFNTFTGQFNDLSMQTGIQVNYVKFNGAVPGQTLGQGILFQQTNNSAVRYCRFDHDGVNDELSTTGNTFVDNIFIGCEFITYNNPTFPNNIPSLLASRPYLGK
jgi:hypothetical protein